MAVYGMVSGFTNVCPAAARPCFASASDAGRERLIQWNTRRLARAPVFLDFHPVAADSRIK